jgi:pyruvate,orthophosphate dikinase
MLKHSSQGYSENPKPVNVMNRYVYSFSEGYGENKQLIGGKGAGLCEMTHIGLPVPPGFVITTQACREYLDNDNVLPDGLADQVRNAVGQIENQSDLIFGDPNRPLLVSVRSGAAVSMPGMMDTILNLGLNDDTTEGLISRSQSEQFGWDTYRRFISLFGSVVLKINHIFFDNAIEDFKKEKRVTQDMDLTASDLRDLVKVFKDIVQDKTGKALSQDPYEQLFMAIEAVFASWNGKRAKDYRREFKITPQMANGTAVNVQAMVFGNIDYQSATGVAFTRNPDTGENSLFGDYLTKAQGEDIVAGTRTPKPISEMRQAIPEVYEDLLRSREILENHFKEVQDIEFTVERRKLYLLQTRNAKMTINAALKTSVDMVAEGLITKEKALLRLEPFQLKQLMYTQVDPAVNKAPDTTGLGVSPGAAFGEVVFDADEAERQGNAGKKVILLREQTNPEDIHGLFAAQGILTAVGGKTSHAAVVARSIGKPCVTGAVDLKINQLEKAAFIGENKIAQGTVITIDGSSGKVWIGEIPLIEPEIPEHMDIVLKWADEYRRLGIWANADTVSEAKKALEFGAQGIGLCRTERMFNDIDRIGIFQEMILADTTENRTSALERLKLFQKKDFKEIFQVMQGRPVTIRLLDPPLHEFLPSEEETKRQVKKLQEYQTALVNVSKMPGLLSTLDRNATPIIDSNECAVNNLAEIQLELNKKLKVLEKIRSLREINPMLGHRGVRLGITYPEIYEMQIEAMLEAASELAQEEGIVKLQIMVPNVCTCQELQRVQDMIIRVEEKLDTKGIRVSFRFGTMIEVVRACLRADKLAELAEFFSFGTNDLTQAVFSFSREDAENKFLPLYNNLRILQENPFETLDQKGVGKLMELAVTWGRKCNPDLEIGICGEHGGDPSSVEFCHTIGLDYVSCSPYKIPIAILAAAQAAIKEKKFTHIESNVT